MNPMTASLRTLLSRRLFEDRLEELIGIALDAIDINPLDWINSIFGPVKSWLPPHDGYSEFSIINLWRLRRTLKYLVTTSVPAIPTNPPPFGPPLLNNLFWHPTVILQRPDHNGSYTTFPDESWFFINGIMTNDSLAQLNAAYLAYLFHRPITLIQNATSSFWIDLLECAIGKEWNRMTEPAIKAFPPIHAALKNPAKKKVIIVAHSQGTIITANVLNWLKQRTVAEPRTAPPGPPLIPDVGRFNVVAIAPESYYVPAEPVFVFPDDEPLILRDFEPLTARELAKLEIYSFATCANEMTYFQPPAAGDAPIPWIEHFGNEMDIVARLGMLAPRPDKWKSLRIDGPRFVHKGAWGHFLNVHYLFDIQARQKRGRKPGGKGNADPYVLYSPERFPTVKSPRLFGYINGGIVED